VKNIKQWRAWVNGEAFDKHWQHFASFGSDNFQNVVFNFQIKWAIIGSCVYQFENSTARIKGKSVGFLKLPKLISGVFEKTSDTYFLPIEYQFGNWPLLPNQSTEWSSIGAARESRISRPYQKHLAFQIVVIVIIYYKCSIQTIRVLRNYKMSLIVYFINYSQRFLQKKIILIIYFYLNWHCKNECLVGPP